MFKTALYWASLKKGGQSDELHVLASIYCTESASSFRRPEISNPANTKRDKHVIITSKSRFDVMSASLLRFVFAGQILLNMSEMNYTNYQYTV